MAVACGGASTSDNVSADLAVSLTRESVLPARDEPRVFKIKQPEPGQQGFMRTHELALTLDLPFADIDDEEWTWTTTDPKKARQMRAAGAEILDPFPSVKEATESAADFYSQLQPHLAKLGCTSVVLADERSLQAIAAANDIDPGDLDALAERIQARVLNVDDADVALFGAIMEIRGARYSEVEGPTYTTSPQGVPGGFEQKSTGSEVEATLALLRPGASAPWWRRKIHAYPTFPLRTDHTHAFPADVADALRAVKFSAVLGKKGICRGRSAD